MTVSAAPLGVAAALRLQLERQVSHWEAAGVGLSDPSSFASPTAWLSLERYLDRAVRTSLAAATDKLRRDVGGLRVQLDHATTHAQLMQVGRRLQQVRRQHGQVETVVTFFTDAVNTRTSTKLGTHMRALDRIAHASMATTLVPLGREIPPVLTYVDRGLGAAILRSGVRLWDGQLSPAAAIKVTRHNLFRPSSLVHETGHQVAHIIGWNREAKATITGVLRDDPELAAIWASWTSEITADVYAFVHCGYAAVAALHDVVANEFETVMRFTLGDPHPISYIRVLLGVAMCRSAYGAGPWDALASAWVATHQLSMASPMVASVLRRSITRLSSLASTLLNSELACFGSRSIAGIVDPQRVAPAALERLSVSAGPSLMTSSHVASRESLRVVALTGLQIATDPRHTTRYVGDFARFTQTLGMEGPLAA